LPCPEGIEIEWVIWDLDQIPARGIEQIKEWYAEFPVKASACVECGVCVERCPFDVEILAKMREAVEVFEEQTASCTNTRVIGKTMGGGLRRLCHPPGRGARYGHHPICQPIPF
jgi:ferredoxin